MHVNQIQAWRKQLLENISDIFSSTEEKKRSSEQDIKELQAKIGQLTMENDFSYGSFCQLAHSDFSQTLVIWKSSSNRNGLSAR